MTDHDYAFSSTSKEDIHALRGGQKPNIPARITSRKRYDDNVAFFALVVVYHNDV